MKRKARTDKEKNHQKYKRSLALSRESVQSNKQYRWTSDNEENSLNLMSVIQSEIFTCLLRGSWSPLKTLFRKVSSVNNNRLNTRVGSPKKVVLTCCLEEQFFAFLGGGVYWYYIFIQKEYCRPLGTSTHRLSEELTQ